MATRRKPNGASWTKAWQSVDNSAGPINSPSYPPSPKGVELNHNVVDLIIFCPERKPFAQLIGGPFKAGCLT